MSQSVERERGAPLWLVLAGLPIGFVSSLAGIGGGLMTGMLLHFALGFDLKRSTGTALVLVLATTLASTVTEALQPTPALHWPTIGFLVAGAVVGAWLGFAFSERVPERALRVIFAVVLAFSGVRLLAGGELGEGGSIDLALGARDQAWAVLVGLGGGFVAPVLGVGGGLVVVPGLFLGVPGFGFDAARACSLATGTVGSTWALFLKARAGRVSFRHGLLLGLGALLGAAGGVFAKGSSDLLLQLGRVTIALVCLYAAVRFARDALRRG